MLITYLFKNRFSMMDAVAMSLVAKMHAQNEWNVVQMLIAILVGFMVVAFLEAILK